MFFDASKLPSAKNEYVCWLDVMGTSSIMLKSVATATNFICKLHIAALEVKGSNVLYKDLKLYPMLDGLHITSCKQSTLIGYLKDIFSKAADDFISQTSPQYKFIIKAAIAYGPVIHGNSITTEATKELGDSTYKTTLLFGMPVIQAYKFEKEAPPFGIFIHESARSFSPNDESPIPHIWYVWAEREKAATLWQKLSEQYVWYKKHSQTQNYLPTRIESHLKMAEEYFTS